MKLSSARAGANSSCQQPRIKAVQLLPCRQRGTRGVVRWSSNPNPSSASGLAEAPARSGWTDLLKGMASAVLATSLVLTPLPADASQVVRLPASNNPEIFAAQRTLVEAWTIVGESFVDPEFNALDWPEELREHMMAAYRSDSAPEKAWDEINTMLSELGDPYTRRIPPEDYQAFRVSADGELQGIGLLIANEPGSTGHLRVLAPIKGGPADRAGILPGDEITTINGQDTAGWSGDQAAKALRGRGGTEVHVRLVRRTDGIPGVPSRPEPAVIPAVQVKEVDLKREAVVISNVYSTALQGRSGKPVGYIRLSQFSALAPAEMRRAVATLKEQGAESFILDLRANPGGLVQAGVDVAAMWLNGEKTVFTVSSREAGTQVQTTESTAPALTNAPMVVLVDKMSASASEIVSGALHDNDRAIVMGDSSTYGKGRIQSVFELQDGSALFVTVAKYQTPNGTDIDLKGIQPDRTCKAPSFANAIRFPGRAPLQPVSSRPRLAHDVFGMPLSKPAALQGLMTSTPVVAESNPSFMPGIPLDGSTEELLLDALRNDRCVLAAERLLASQTQASPSTQVRLTPAQDLYLALIEGPRATL